MAYDLNRSTNNESLWEDLFGGKGGILLLTGGLLLILINIVVFLGVDIRPSTWLFNLNMRYWSIHVAVIFWITVIWLTAELADIVEDYRQFVRISAVIGTLLVIVFGLHSFFSTPSPHAQGSPLWVSAIIVAAVCCAVRSLWLLYDYRYGEEEIDLEEAQWFWGMSGFLFAVLIIIGMMHIIHIKVPTHPGMDTYGSESLFKSCRNALQVLIRNGAGTVAIRALAFLIFTASIAFVYVAGKWALIYMYRLKERWE